MMAEGVVTADAKKAEAGELVLEGKVMDVPDYFVSGLFSMYRGTAIGSIIPFHIQSHSHSPKEIYEQYRVN